MLRQVNIAEIFGRRCIHYNECPIRQMHRYECDGYGVIRHTSLNKRRGIVEVKCEDYDGLQKTRKKE